MKRDWLRDGRFALPPLELFCHGRGAEVLDVEEDGGEAAHRDDVLKGEMRGWSSPGLEDAM